MRSALALLAVVAALVAAGCGSGDAESKVVPADQGTKMSPETKAKGGPPGASQM